MRFLLGAASLVLLLPLLPGRVDASSWTREVVSSAFNADATTLVLDGAGQPHVSAPLNGSVRYSRRVDGAWVSQDIAIPVEPASAPQDAQILYSFHCRLAVSPSLEPWFAWSKYNFQPHTPIYGPMKLVHEDVSSWTAEPFEADTDPLDVRVFDDGEVQLLYDVHAFTPLAVRYAHREADAWTIETIAQAIVPASMAVGNDLLPRVVHRVAGSVDMRFAVRDGGGSWSTQDIPAPPGATDVLRARLVLDGDGEPHVALLFRFDPGGDRLYYARRDGPGWVCEAVEGAGSNLLACDIAWSPVLGVVLGFSRGVPADVQVARRVGPGWQFDIVEAGETPWTLSMAADPMGGIWLVHADGIDSIALYGASPFLAVFPGAATARLRLRPAVNPLRGGRALALLLDSPEAGRVRLDALDAMGRRIASGEWRAVPAGASRMEWSARLPAGLSFIRVTSDQGAVATARIVTLD